MSHNSEDLSYGPATDLLRIAKKHLNYIKMARSKDIRVPGPKLDHARVASVFSAAAIEAALNSFIIAPLLFIEDQAIRRFYATLLTRYVRLPASRKIEFATQVSPLLRKDKKLVKQAKAVFSHRNIDIHSPLEYAEPLALPDRDDLPTGIEIDHLLVAKPTFYTKATGSDAVREAFHHFNVACQFIQKLSQCTPTPSSQ